MWAGYPDTKKVTPLGDDSIFPYLILLMILRRVKDLELSAPGKQLWEQEEIA